MYAGLDARYTVAKLEIDGIAFETERLEPSLNPTLLDTRFVLLLAATGLMRLWFPARWYVPTGVLCSAALLLFSAPTTLVVILVVTLAYLYPIGLAIRRAKSHHSGKRMARRWLWIGVGGLVLLMVVFKLQRQFSLPFLSSRLLNAQVASLIGFSYFLFRAINYLYILYLTDMPDRSPWTLLFYTLFPPTITSGPIQKYADFHKQTTAPVRLGVDTITEATYRITRGYFRKICVAFLFDELVQSLLAQESLTAYASLLTIASLYLYFYFDFAGYSDIAIGFGLLLGIRVPENFRQPLLATSITEFWRHWHITLADWFRDHVFIPLGGMRTSRMRAASVALLIMVVCGLWHGVTAMYVLWGLWHGLALFLEGVMGSKPMAPRERRGPRYWVRVARTNAIVAIGALFFLPSADTALLILRGFLRWW